MRLDSASKRAFVLADVGYLISVRLFTESGAMEIYCVMVDWLLAFRIVRGFFNHMISVYILASLLYNEYKPNYLRKLMRWRTINPLKSRASLFTAIKRLIVVYYL